MFIRELEQCVDFKRMHYIAQEHRSAWPYMGQYLELSQNRKKKKKKNACMV